MAHNKVYGFCESGCKVETLPTTGGSMTGNINFGNNTRGLSWTLNDGTLIAIRPDVDIDLFQIVFVPPGGTAFEAFGIKSDGTPMFHTAIPIREGGTGAADAATARQNLGITPANIGAAAKSHSHSKSQITDFPSSMPASDVYGWAKSPKKPAYTANEVGALPTTGGSMTGNINFGNNTRGLSWTLDDGTLVALRPDVGGNLFQIVFVPPGGKAFEAFGIKSDGTPMFHTAIPIREGGTGAADAATARQNLEITPVNIGALPAAGGYMTGNVDFGNNTRGLIWKMNDGTGVYLRPDVGGNLFQIVFTPPGGMAFEAFGIKPDGTPQFYKPLGIDFGGTGATAKKAARKNLGAEIQCGVANDVGTSGVQITFSEAFSGIPVVTATGGSENASVYVRNITTTGFTLASGTGNNDGVQWQAIYISD